MSLFLPGSPKETQIPLVDAANPVANIFPFWKLTVIWNSTKECKRDVVVILLITKIFCGKDGLASDNRQPDCHNPLHSGWKCLHNDNWTTNPCDNLFHFYDKPHTGPALWYDIRDVNYHGVSGLYSIVLLLTAHTTITPFNKPKGTII